MYCPATLNDATKDKHAAGWTRRPTSRELPNAEPSNSTARSLSPPPGVVVFEDSPPVRFSSPSCSSTSTCAPSRSSGATKKQPKPKREYSTGISMLGLALLSWITISGHLPPSTSGAVQHVFEHRTRLMKISAGLIAITLPRRQASPVGRTSRSPTWPAPSRSGQHRTGTAASHNRSGRRKWDTG